MEFKLFKVKYRFIFYYSKMEDSNEEYFNYLDTIPLDILMINKQNVNPLLTDYLTSRYRNGKYNHMEISYLFYDVSDNSREYIYNAVKNMLVIMIERKIEAVRIHKFIYIWNKINTGTRCIIDIEPIIVNITDCDYLKQLLVGYSYITTEIFKTLYDTNKEKLKELICCMKGEEKENNRILCWCIWWSGFCGWENYDKVVNIIHMVIDNMNIDLTTIKSDNVSTMKFIEKLREEQV